jgi:dihydrofolate reductase
MRNLVLYSLVSLDGVAEEPGDWFFDDGPEVFTNLSRIIERQDDVVLGRGTYDYWVDYWPTSDVEPFASFINSTPKHVVTSSVPDRAWSKATLVTSPLDEHLGALRRTEGGDIGVHGSIALAGSLLAARMVDVLHLAVAPSIAGRGRRLFPDAASLQQLELSDVERTAAGTLFLTYRRTAPRP